MSFFRKGQGDARAPEAAVLPDGRKRLTCFRLVTGVEHIAGDLAAAYGSLHPDDNAAPSGWTGLRLVDRRVTDEQNQPGKDTRPVRVLVYEELPATAEIQVGNNTKTQLEDGRAAVEADFLQLVAGSYVAGTVGSTSAPGDSSAYLQKVETTDDGTLRRIKRTYVHSGTIATEDESLQGGALLKKTIVSVKDVPATPSGYTLVGSPVQSPGGLPVYTYTYYKGSGEISRRYALTDCGASNEPGDAAAAGVNTVTIQHLTATSVSTQPTSNPNNVCVVLDIAHEDQDGHRLWTVKWVHGTMQTQTVATRTSNGGKLVIYHGVGFGVAPGAPSATIGGTVTQIATSEVAADGYTVYDYTWAEGFGEVSRSTVYGQSSAGDGSVGSTTIEIVHLTVQGASDPTSAPSGCAKVASVPAVQDGYTVWRVTYAKGVGLVVTTNDVRQGGKLVLYRRVALGSAPSAPSATIGGTVTTTGTGYREEAGYKVYDYTWAEGQGAIADEKIPRTDGLLEWHRTILSADTLPITASDFDTTWKPTANAVLYQLRPSLQDGYTVSEAAWMVAADGTSAPTAATVTLPRTVSFTVPGLAAAANPPTFQPPITRRLKATVYITYSTTANTDSLYSVTAWAQFFESYTRKDDGRQYNEVKALDGYVGSSSYSASNTTYRGIDVSAVVSSVSGSTPTSLPSGATVLEVDAEVAFVKYDGTIYYRNTSVKFTF